MSDELVSRKPSETAPAHKRAAELTNSLHHIIVVGGGARHRLGYAGTSRTFPHLVNACIRAHAQTAPVRPGQLHVTIIGAGATGTELAAELHRTTREVVAYGLDRIDPAKDLHITLIEAADRILPALPLRISEATARLLADLGVDVRTKAKVSRVRRDGVELAGGDFIPSELVVWAAGVKGPDVLGALDGLEVSRANQLVVTPTLQTTRDP